MPNIKELDPGASPLHYFGSELRRFREKAGLTLAQLGSAVFLTGSMIGQVETGTKIPRDEHVPRLDAVLSADGGLLRAWELVKRSRLPLKLRQIAEIESGARAIYAHQPLVVHGLLQTEEYARTVLGATSTADLEERVAGRLARQRMLEWDKPPLLWVVMWESVLHHAFGGPGVMRGQLQRLLSYRDCRHVQIQVLPFSAGIHAGTVGAFSLYTYDDQPTLLYGESHSGVDATVDKERVKEYSLRYDLLQATALSPSESAGLIERVMKERYGQGTAC